MPLKLKRLFDDRARSSIEEVQNFCRILERATNPTPKKLDEHTVVN